MTTTYNIKLTVKLLNGNTETKKVSAYSKKQLDEQLDLLLAYATTKFAFDAVGWSISYSPSGISLVK